MFNKNKLITGMLYLIVGLFIYMTIVMPIRITFCENKGMTALPLKSKCIISIGNINER